MPPTENQPPPAAAPRVHPWTIWAIVITIVLGMVVGYNYIIYKVRGDYEKELTEGRRPPILHRLETDFEGVERSGKAVQLSQLKGKIMVAGYVFTRCPRGCAGVVAIMKLLQREFGDDPRFQLLSFSLDAKHDTPAVLRQFAGAQGVAGDNWWFLTGDQTAIRDYMTNVFKFYPVQDVPEADRVGDSDLYAHDMRLAIVDHRGHVRGFYEVMHPQMSDIFYDNLVRDLKKLFQEADEAAAR